MGMFQVTVRVANPGFPARTADVALLVDTGATLSWLPRTVVERLGLAAEAQVSFALADGRELVRSVGPARMTINGISLTVPVAFGEKGETAVLGATSLEILGFAVDPVDQKLIPRKHLNL